MESDSDEDLQRSKGPKIAPICLKGNEKLIDIELVSDDDENKAAGTSKGALSLKKHKVFSKEIYCFLESLVKIEVLQKN